MRCLLSEVVLLVVVLPCPAMPFCGGPPTTLRDELTQASAVLCGKLTRATPSNPAAEGGGGITDFVIEKTLKKHPLLAGRDTLTIPRYIPLSNGVAPRFLIFVDIDNKGRPDPYRGIPMPARSDVARYVEGIQRIKDKKTV